MCYVIMAKSDLQADMTKIIFLNFISISTLRRRSSRQVSARCMCVWEMKFAFELLSCEIPRPRRH